MIPILGVDIAKQKFDVALLVNNHTKNKKYQNNQQGFAALTKWLESLKISKTHTCMEATGTYGNALATYLYSQGHTVSVVNPAKIKGFAQSSLNRNKTDTADAKIIAHFCKALNPSPWQPEPEYVTTLQALTKRLDNLMDLQQQEKNRLDSANPIIAGSLKKTIAYLQQEIDSIKEQITQHIKQNPDLQQKHDLLKTIPGLGHTTIAKILAYVCTIKRFKNAKQLAAFFGLSPKNHESGSSIHRKTRICKSGNSHLRCSLYFPAIVAIRYNEAIKKFSERLAKSAKNKMLIICAAMRKLVHIIYGVLKSNKGFDPQLACANLSKH